jgi:hypothetical protein
MPLIAVNLSDKLFYQITELVERGLYLSPEAFLEIAAFNQLALERGATPTEIIEKGHRKARHEAEGPAENGPAKVRKPATTMSFIAEQTARPPKAASPRRAVEAVAKVIPPPEPAVSEKDFTAAFKRLAWVVQTEASPPSAIVDPEKLSTGRIFGQVNRLLPIKIACRWLATAAATEGKWPRFDAISEQLADDAATVGSLLETWDAESERKRDELLATGLPRRGNAASKDRFLSQNLARVTRGGEIYPATICQYQLARFDDSVIALTEQGLAFAEIENPIVDKRDAKTAVTLAPEESEFLSRQILEWVPAERDDMRLVLRAVKGGKMKPSELTEALRAQFPADWTDSVFQTHVSGLVARLGELRLMKRVWQGRNVTYELGDKVDDFLKMPNTKECPRT